MCLFILGLSEALITLDSLGSFKLSHFVVLPTKTQKQKTIYFFSLSFNVFSSLSIPLSVLYFLHYLQKYDFTSWKHQLASAKSSPKVRSLLSFYNLLIKLYPSLTKSKRYNERPKLL